MDGFGRLYEAMRDAGQTDERAGQLRLRLGRILTVKPLSVDVAGTEQEEERFYISTRLMSGEQALLKLSGGTGGFSANQYTHSVIMDEGTLSLMDVTAHLMEPVIQAGDLVVLLTEDDQTFYLLDRVVRCV